MNKLLIIPVLLMFINSNAQDFNDVIINFNEGGSVPYNYVNGTNSRDFYVGNPNEWSKIMGVFYEFDDIRFGKMGFEGSVYLFDEWENKGVIVIGKKRYIVDNINFHIVQSVFMSKIEGDSTFVYNAKGIDEIYVKDKLYKNFYNSNEGTNKFYEVIYEDQKTTILKGYTVTLIQASPNPMVNRSKNKIKRHSSYYIFKNGGIQSFKLKKSSILNLIGNDYVQNLQQYVKDNNLSYKKENNVIKMLNYVSKL